MLGKLDMNLFVKSKEECYFVNGLEVVSFHDIFTEIGVVGPNNLRARPSCSWKIRRPKPRRAVAQALQYRSPDSFGRQPRTVQSSADPESHQNKGVKLV